MGPMSPLSRTSSETCKLRVLYGSPILTGQPGSARRWGTERTYSLRREVPFTRINGFEAVQFPKIDGKFIIQAQARLQLFHRNDGISQCGREWALGSGTLVPTMQQQSW